MKGDGSFVAMLLKDDNGGNMRCEYRNQKQNKKTQNHVLKVKTVRESLSFFRIMLSVIGQEK